MNSAIACDEESQIRRAAMKEASASKRRRSSSDDVTVNTEFSDDSVEEDGIYNDRMGNIHRNIMRSARCVLILLLIMLLTLCCGKAMESYHIRTAQDTLRFYQNDRICAIREAENQHSVTFNFESLSSPEEADSATVAHCGDCGACSNQHDISIYDETKDSLLDTTISCAKRAFIFGRKTSGKCMKEKVGLTPACNECWVENIMCDLRKCVFTCVWYILFEQYGSDNSDGTKQLNKCTMCDELRCGPDFITCAGANRRRSGILSDIDRDQDHEVCAELTPGWWNDPYYRDAGVV